jgi:hypothetical protein
MVGRAMMCMILKRRKKLAFGLINTRALTICKIQNGHVKRLKKREQTMTYRLIYSD